MASSVSSVSLPMVIYKNGVHKSSPSSNCLIFNYSSKRHHHYPFSLSPSSSSSPASFVETDEDDDRTFSGCRGCGKEEKESGCNGEGRIQGGIATVPGFGWWPIKAYRPCPSFVEAGGRYRPLGQSMDEVAFGRRDSTSATDSQLSYDIINICRPSFTISI